MKTKEEEKKEGCISMLLDEKCVLEYTGGKGMRERRGLKNKGIALSLCRYD